MTAIVCESVDVEVVSLYTEPIRGFSANFTDLETHLTVQLAKLLSQNAQQADQLVKLEDQLAQQANKLDHLRNQSVEHVDKQTGMADQQAQLVAGLMNYQGKL